LRQDEVADDHRERRDQAPEQELRRDRLKQDDLAQSTLPLKSDGLGSKQSLPLAHDHSAFHPIAQSSTGFVLAPVLPPAAATWSSSAALRARACGARSGVGPDVRLASVAVGIWDVFLIFSLLKFSLPHCCGRGGR
jgi:hypothetical protein